MNVLDTCLRCNNSTPKFFDVNENQLWPTPMAAPPPPLPTNQLAARPPLIEAVGLSRVVYHNQMNALVGQVRVCVCVRVYVCLWVFVCVRVYVCVCFVSNISKHEMSYIFNTFMLTLTYFANMYVNW